jgi:hypothetical protein
MNQERSRGLFRGPRNELPQPAEPAPHQQQASPPGGGQAPGPSTQTRSPLTREVRRALEDAAAAVQAVKELRGQTVRLTQKASQLERSLAKHDTELQALSSTMAEHAALLSRHAARQGEQGELLAATAQTLTRYIEAVDNLRARLFIEDRSLADADFLVHYQIGERLKRLFTQRLPDLSNVGAGTGPGDVSGTAALRREAQQVRLMCQALFEGDEPNLERLAAIVTGSGQVTLSEPDDRLLERVQQEAARLRRDIEGTGHPYIFIFDLPAETRADSSQYELWTSAVAGEPVAFVVTPGYVVSGRRILLPAVITGSRDESGKTES